jgi:hypothetical protein
VVARTRHAADAQIAIASFLALAISFGALALVQHWTKRGPRAERTSLVERIGILLACMPRILGEILAEHIEGQADMQILGELVNADELTSAMNRLAPDLVVIGAEAEDPPATCAALLRQAPGVKVIAIERDGRRATLYELRPARTLVADPSVQSFLGLIRSAVDPARADAVARAAADREECGPA